MQSPTRLPQRLDGVLLKLGVSLTIMAQSEDYAHGRMILTAVEDLKRLSVT